MSKAWLVRTLRVAGQLAPLLAALVVAPRPAHAVEDVLPPQIVHEPCEFYQKGEAFNIVARFNDDSAIFDPKVVYRSQKVNEWRTAPFARAPGTDDFVASIKAKDLKGPLEYFIETFDENGNGPARYGSPEAPVRVMPSENAPECFQTGEEAYAPTVSAGSNKGGKPEKGEGKGGEKGGEAKGVEKGGEAKGGEKSGEAKGGEAKGGTAQGKPPQAGGTAPAGNGAQTNGQGQQTGGVPAGGQTGAQGNQGGPAGPGPGRQVVKIDQPPPPAKTGCDADDPPTYCSPILWTLVGIGVAGAGAGAGVGIYFATRPPTTTHPTPPSTVDLHVSIGSVTGTLP